MMGLLRFGLIPMRSSLSLSVLGLFSSLDVLIWLLFREGVELRKY